MSKLLCMECGEDFYDMFNMDHNGTFGDELIRLAIQDGWVPIYNDHNKYVGIVCADCQKTIETWESDVLECLKEDS